jgi:hypothetical protein
MLKPVTFIEKEHGDVLEVDIAAIPDWDGYEKLIKFLIKYYKVEVLQRIEGPDAKRCVLKLGNIRFELQHEDPYGNQLVAKGQGAIDLVREIGHDLARRLG